MMSPPLAGAWIEILEVIAHGRETASPPLAGAWIEIRIIPVSSASSSVAPPRGGVD